MDEKFQEFQQLANLIISKDQLYNPAQINQANSRLMEILNDPAEAFQLLLQTLNGATKPNLSLFCLTQISTRTFYYGQALTQVLSPEILMFLFQTLSQLADSVNESVNKSLSDYVFQCIYDLIEIIKSDESYHFIIDKMATYLQQSKAHYAISFFAQFITNFLDEKYQIQNDDLFQNIISLTQMIESSDPQVRLETFRLVYNLLLYSPEQFLEIYSQIIPQSGIPSLPPSLMKIALSNFTEFFCSQYQTIAEYSESYLIMCLSIANEPCEDPSPRMCALECASDMFNRSPYIAECCGSNFDLILQTLSSIFKEFSSADLASSESGLYNIAQNFLESLCQNSDIKNVVKSSLPEMISNGNLSIVSPFIAQCPNPQYFEVIVECIQNEDYNICNNGLTALESLIIFQFPRTKQIIGLQPLFNFFGQLYNNNTDERQRILDIFASYIERIQEYSCNDFLQQNIDTIIQLVQEIPCSETLRGVAALFRAFPNQFVQQASDLSNLAINLIENIIEKEGNAESKEIYALLFEIATFIQQIPSEEKEAFFEKLSPIIYTYPETTCSPGLRLIAKEMGSGFSSFIPNIVPKLLQILSTPITFYKTRDDWSSLPDDYTKIVLPGSTSKVLISGEEIDDKVKAVKALSSFMKTFGQNAFQEYLDQIYEIINKFNNDVINEKLRSLSYKLLGAISITFPDQVPIALEKLFDIINEEIEINVQKTGMKVLRRICDNYMESNISNQIFSTILGMIPQFIQKINEETKQFLTDDDYIQHDSTQDALWEIITILQHSYKHQPKTIQEYFPKISEQLVDFQTCEIPVLARFSLAVWGDMFESTPFEYSAQFGEMLNSVISMINSKDEELVRLSLDTMGHIFQKSKDNTIKVNLLQQIVQKVNEIEEDPESSEGLKYAADSGKGSFVLLIQSMETDGYEYIGQLLELLPVSYDMDQAKVVYEYLIKYITSVGVPQEAIQVIVETIIENLMEDDDIKMTIQQLIQSKYKDSFPTQIQPIIQSLNSDE